MYNICMLCECYSVTGMVYACVTQSILQYCLSDVISYQTPERTIKSAVCVNNVNDNLTIHVVRVHFWNCMLGGSP